MHGKILSQQSFGFLKTMLSSNQHLQTVTPITGDRQNQGLYLKPSQRKLLLKSLKSDMRQEYKRRIEIMLLADMGYSQTQICNSLGCSQETARYWIKMAQSGQALNWENHPMGRPKTINSRYLDRLQELAVSSPKEFGYAFHHWTAGWLSKHLAAELGIEISDRHVSRLLKKMGLSTRTRKDPELEALSQPDVNSRILISSLGPVSSPEIPELWLFKTSK